MARKNDLEIARRRFYEDWPFYAEHCLSIIDTNARTVPFLPKPAQLRIDAAAEEQRKAGRPMRILVPKARKEGVSTYTTGKIVQRVTQRPNHNAIQVAQDADTSGELIQLAMFMHANLPDSDLFDIKPPIANRQRRKEMVFGNPDQASKAAGDFGLNSRLIVQPAGEFEAGRGYTFHSVHGSECAFWPDLKRKLTSLLNAVPDEPETFVLLESTSNGHNHWKNLCLQALEGRSDFVLVFLSWFEEPQYTRAFDSPEEREKFIASIGTGPYGEDEPDLVEQGVTPEQLNWRRWAIANRCQDDLRVFKQEYPANLMESFGSTGRTVFNPTHVERLQRAVDALPEPTEGTLEATTTKTIPSRFGTVNVPQKPRWVEKPGGPWRLWVPVEDIKPEDRYIIAGDPAGDETGMDDADLACHAAQVVDHQTGDQVAELEMQGSWDDFAEQLFLAALLFNQAWVAIERTGGYGISSLKRIRHEWKYPFVYRSKNLTSSRENKEEDRLGWDTNRNTRAVLIDGAIEMLKEQSHGIRSKKLVRQIGTFVKDNKGKPVPAPGERSDLLMAWMIARQVALEQPVRKSSGSGVISTTTRAVVNIKTGW